MININCQTRDESISAIQLLCHWTIAQRLKNASLTGQHLGGMIVAGFSGLTSDWWENIPANARNAMLFADDGDQQILKALSKKFHGEDEIDERDHYASLFMTARLCNLAHVEEYFCYM